MNNTLQTKYLVNYTFIPNGNKSNNLQLQATSMEICYKTKYNQNDVVYKSNPPFVFINQEVFPFKILIFSFSFYNS